MLMVFVLGLGALSHVVYFSHGEHHMHGIIYLRILASFHFAIVLLLWQLQGHTFVSSLYNSAKIEIQFFIGLFSSIVTYRLAPIHRLHAYSGPLSWRISKLAHTWSNRKLENFRNLYAAHEKYGDYVRTGPSEISTIDSDVVAAVLGPKSKCTRAAWYEMAYPVCAIFHTRSKAEHEKRRQVWSSGLSWKALKAYQLRIESNIASLVHQIERNRTQDQSMNVSRWFNYLSFDIMGDVEFARPFGMLESGEKLEVLKKLEDGQKGLGVFGVVPWLFMILTRIPVIRKEHDAFDQRCKKQIMGRQGRKIMVPDIAAALIEDEKSAANPEVSQQWLAGDSRILIVAGSDAFASSLVFAFLYFAQDHRHQITIRSELEDLNDGSGWDASALQMQAPYLNAFIAEVLWLWPPNPSGVLRQTPKEGLKINDRFIPGDITVCAPFWVLHRCKTSHVPYPSNSILRHSQQAPKCFAQPLDFIPERWSSRPELVLQKDAYIPFGSGAYACIGKQLALMELRLTIAELVSKFEVLFSPGEDGRALMEESKDCFTWGVTDLNLVFRRCN
ncbi:hypothetical protein HBI73_046080 [Parastagonospora nodorum]|nr:hypothetical protein HBI73_046080 [Parastagonospora nodorum]